METEIIELLRNENRALAFSEIREKIETNDYNSINDALKKLEQNFVIYRNKNNRYVLYESSTKYMVGKLDIKKDGYGFLINPKGDDIFIPMRSLNGAIHDDKVLVEHNGDSGKVIKIIERNLNNLVGEIVFENHKALLKLDNDKRNLKIIIKDPKINNCVEGTKILAKLEKNKNKNTYIASIAKIIGHKNDPDVDILSVALKYGFDNECPKEVMDQVDLIETEVKENDLQARTDLTSKEIFTIDGDDTKDIDDAISLETKDNKYILGVHIADVSHYVTKNSPLDKDALKRGTSAYLADSVIPMLPHKLSNGICSLNEGVIRLTITAEMMITENGEIEDVKIYPSYIKSRKKMTYKKVNDILMRNIVDPEYISFTNVLKNMNKLAYILRKAKIKRGYLEFAENEAKVVVDENKHVAGIKKVVREDGEKLIEDFMIAANESVATTITNMGLNFIYRIHENPSPDKIDEFIHLSTLFGATYDYKLNSYTPLDIQKILNNIKDMEKFPFLSDLMLRSMKKAVYSKENLGHFGLGSKCYTHFTSPIRRYPDLTVHRLLRTYLFEHHKDASSKNGNEIVYIAEQSSLMEQNSIEAEREVLSMKMAEYMSEHIGEIFDGIISSVTNFGFYVILDNLVEGLVHISTLEDDRYNYNETLLSLLGENHGKKYRLGDKVRIIVEASNKETRNIDFKLVGEESGNQE